MAQATTFHQDYDSIFQSKSERAAEGTHSFEIDGIPQWYQTKWYIDGGFVETDYAGFLALDPQVTYTFQPGTFEIEGRVYTDQGLFVKSRSWDFFCGPPDMMILNIFSVPAYPLAGTTFKIGIVAKNIGATDANAGPLRDQEANFYFKSGFVGEANYDDVSSHAIFVELYSPDISHNQPGEFSIRAIVDANSEIAEANESNNEKTGSITIRGPDWLEVPHVQGKTEQEAENALLAAGFPAPIVKYVFDETVLEGIVINQPWDQYPGADWTEPNEVFALAVSIGPSCAVKVIRPKKRQTWEIGSLQKIKWNTTGTCCDMVRLELWQNGEKLRTIKNATPNDGKFDWLIAPERYAPGSKHQVRVFCDKHRNGFSKGRLRLVGGRGRAQLRRPPPAYPQR